MNKIYLYQDMKPREVFEVSDLFKCRLGKSYEVQERIASGGNAVVHKCQDYATGEFFAVKFQLSNTGKRLKRFKQEIDLVKDLEHDQLIKYISDGIINANHKTNKIQLHFLIMVLAESNLADHLKNIKKNLSYAEYIGHFKGLSLALAVIHEKAIHRDIKPENILIRGNNWMISDFGLCKFIEDDIKDLTRIKENIGPRFWMSPEALNRTLGNSDEISKQSDVFQLCAVFWYVVTGRNPFGIVCEEDWNGTPNIFKIIARSLSHDPKKRPKDGRELYNLLEKASLEEAGL